MAYKFQNLLCLLCATTATAFMITACSQQEEDTSMAEEAASSMAINELSQENAMEGSNSGMGTPSGTATSTARTTTNRLSEEQSPYLLQHADNPVDWYPWGTEAFEKARIENKPIFLSIGYSTCHWCHVMARESFEDPEIAQILNEHFVNIKVDREERPDVDKLYMSFVQNSTGSGGWPLSVWLTPDLRPFAGGTYFPPRGSGNRKGFIEILDVIQTSWKDRRENVVAQSEQNTLSLRRLAKAGITDEGEQPGWEPLRKGYTQAAELFDTQFGGFTNAPKFPRPVMLNFLMRFYSQDGGNSAEGRQAIEMSLLTLQKMAAGGLHDHLGGGFHRYCVDQAWQVPHFEKMLYDQAQLALAYLDAYQITQDSFYADITKSTLNYVQRVLGDAGGAFYSAEDAASLFTPDATEKAEGAFYLWTASEVIEQLGEPRAPIFSAYYGILPDGNTPAELRDAFGDYNILVQRTPIAQLATEFKQSEADIRTFLKESHDTLFIQREKRPHPHRDDKIITAWNGLTISAFARAYQVFDNPSYLETATRAAAFLKEHLYLPEGPESTGKLLRSYRNGPSDIPGFLSDYTYLIQGLLDLYEASFDLDWLRWALRLQETQDRLFFDPEQGGYYNVTLDDPSILLRFKEDYDGAEPSPNSVAALNLLRLSQMTGNEAFPKRAAATLQAFSQRLETLPLALPQMLVALQYSLDRPLQIILYGDRDDPLSKEMLRAIHESFLPHKTILFVEEASDWQSIAPSIEFLQNLERIEGKTTAYVCKDYVCELPTNELTVLKRLLSQEALPSDQEATPDSLQTARTPE